MSPTNGTNERKVSQTPLAEVTDAAVTEQVKLIFPPEAEESLRRDALHHLSSCKGPFVVEASEQISETETEYTLLFNETGAKVRVYVERGSDHMGQVFYYRVNLAKIVALPGLRPPRIPEGPFSRRGPLTEVEEEFIGHSKKPVG